MEKQTYQELKKSGTLKQTWTGGSKEVNVHIDEAPSGLTDWPGLGVQTFAPNEEIENNTASPAQTISDENGSYVVELIPGSYEVTADQLVNESGQNVTYTFSGLLEVEAAKSFDIALAREELP